jgi:hypothetical protein
MQSTLTMVRTQCCQGYKQFGERCSICPNRPENRAAVAEYKRESKTGLGCRGSECSRDCEAKHPSAAASGAFGD